MEKKFDAIDSLFLVDVEDEAGAPTQTLSFTRCPTVLLTFAANRFYRAANKRYGDRFDIGVGDWRILVMLTRKPGATVTEASAMIGIDKGAISRSIVRLEKRGLVRPGELHSNGRSRGFWLTAQGRQLHDRILFDALARQRVLLNGFEADEITALTDMLRRFIYNLDRLDGPTTS